MIIRPYAETATLIHQQTSDLFSDIPSHHHQGVNHGLHAGEFLLAITSFVQVTQNFAN